MEPLGGTETPEMTQEQKIIRAKVGLLELARQLGNVSQACKILGYSRDSFYRSSTTWAETNGVPCIFNAVTDFPQVRMSPASH
jgi:hypothetical protein